jgi:hypothetical protein
VRQFKYIEIEATNGRQVMAPDVTVDITENNLETVTPFILVQIIFRILSQNPEGVKTRQILDAVFEELSPDQDPSTQSKYDKVTSLFLHLLADAGQLEMNPADGWSYRLPLEPRAER